MWDKPDNRDVALWVNTVVGVVGIILMLLLLIAG